MTDPTSDDGLDWEAIRNDSLLLFNALEEYTFRHAMACQAAGEPILAFSIGMGSNICPNSDGHVHVFLNAWDDGKPDSVHTVWVSRTKLPNKAIGQIYGLRIMEIVENLNERVHGEKVIVPKQVPFTN